MKVDFYYLKVNMITNLVRDYFSLKYTANVGVLFVQEEELLKIICDYCAGDGMGGGQTYTMPISDLLEENDPHVILKLLISQLNTLKDCSY